MPKFYVIDAYNVDAFHYDHKVVEASSAESAASEHGGDIYEDGADWARPVEVIVAEDEHGKNAMRYVIQRRYEITDEVVKETPVTIPPKTDEEEA